MTQLSKSEFMELRFLFHMKRIPLGLWQLTGQMLNKFLSIWVRLPNSRTRLLLTWDLVNQLTSHFTYLSLFLSLKRKKEKEKEKPLLHFIKLITIGQFLDKKNKGAQGKVLRWD